MKPWQCNRCKKRWFDPKPIRDHIRDVHAGQGQPERVPKSERRRREDEEPSMAERAIDAQLARAMGMRSDDDWLLP